jgi:hypothetical protein
MTISINMHWRSKVIIDVSAVNFRQNLGEMLNQVQYRNDSIVTKAHYVQTPGTFHNDCGAIYIDGIPHDFAPLRTRQRLRRRKKSVKG